MHLRKVIHFTFLIFSLIVKIKWRGDFKKKRLQMLYIYVEACLFNV